GLWRGQGSGQAHILGRNTVNFPAGPAFAVLDSPDAPWPAIDETPRISPYGCRGCSLDAQQRPTFRDLVNGVAVEDVFIERQDPSGGIDLERSVKSPAAPPGMYFRVAAGEAVERRDGDVFAIGKNLQIRATGAPMLREAGDHKELLLPV